MANKVQSPTILTNQGNIPVGISRNLGDIHSQQNAVSAVIPLNRNFASMNNQQQKKINAD
jgi:hypothetical protein